MMNAEIPVGICCSLMGAAAVIFHRWLAYQTVAYYQKSPEAKETILAWQNLLIGILFSVIGIVMLFADNGNGLPFVIAGLVGMVFDKQSARQSMASLRSEKTQRVVYLFAGITMLVVGVAIFLSHG
jgi:hypothetical protein